jgi:hypothetical protein
MKGINATNYYRKSGGAKSRDLQFYGPVLEMFLHIVQPTLKGRASAYTNDRWL